MYQVIKAIYQDGVLKPAETLSLENQQQVLVLVLPLSPNLPLPEPDLERVAVLRERATTWLTEQPSNAVRPPLRLSEAQQLRLDKGFEAALGAIRARTSQISPDEIAADIKQALAETRTLSLEEQVHLEAKLDAFLAEWAANGG